MINKIELRDRWSRANAIHPHLAWRLIALAACVTALIALAACGRGASVASGHPQARASASQIGSAIAHGQAAQKAEGEARKCAQTYSGTAFITCMGLHSHHKGAFRHCAFGAFAADIPGKEITFVETDVPNCLVEHP